MKCIKFDHEGKYINDFLKLPGKLYSKNEIIENKDEIRKLLSDEHPLSKYFHLNKFLIYNAGEVVGRFVITTYEKDDNAYIGFFECINDEAVAAFLFREAGNFCKARNYKSITGPVDASFWLKYRLKINLFHKLPYTGEPYNKDYYYDLFIKNGFRVTEHYTSNIYRGIDHTYRNETYEDRFERFCAKGYKIVSPRMENYDKTLEEIYYLLTALYSDFPIYKNVSLEDFKEIFSSYKKIINLDMVKMAYFHNKPVGFFISVPDYGNKVYQLNPLNIIKILNIKKRPKRYVMLYMGVDQEHRGLGKALVFSIMEELKKSGIPSIGALARDGKVTQNYASEDIEEKYEYVLLKRDVE